MLTHADYVDFAVRVDVGEPYSFTEHGYVTATQYGHLSFYLGTSQFYGAQSLLVLSSNCAWRNTMVLMHLHINAHTQLLCVKLTFLMSTNQNFFHLFADI